MRYFYTPRIEKIVLASEFIVLTAGFALWILVHSSLLFPTGVLPLWFLDLYLRNHKPPVKGERRWEHVNYYQRIQWDGEKWVIINE